MNKFRVDANGFSFYGKPPKSNFCKFYTAQKHILNENFLQFLTFKEILYISLVSTDLRRLIDSNTFPL